MFKEHPHLSIERGRTRIEIEGSNKTKALVSDKRFRVEAGATRSKKRDVRRAAVGLKLKEPDSSVD
jgi:hypothetical protein